MKWYSLLFLIPLAVYLTACHRLMVECNELSALVARSEAARQ